MSEKEYVGNLLIYVLTNQISVREAILNFPKDTTDINIMAAYHALVHYEADEEQRNLDFEFREEQDNYIYLIAELLKQNKDLPKNIIKSYEEYYPQYTLPKRKNIVNLIKSLCKFLNVK